jgi:GNAT superfamily N-acetyltransferase
VLISTEPTQEQVTALWQKLNEFNSSKTGPIDYTQLLLESRNAAGELEGGLIGNIYDLWLHVHLLWVAEEARGRGLGSRLLAIGEEQARARGCKHSWLDTFSFQAPDFYAKRGYVAFGVLEDYPRGERHFFLRKAIG